MAGQLNGMTVAEESLPSSPQPAVWKSSCGGVRSERRLRGNRRNALKNRFVLKRDHFKPLELSERSYYDT